MASIFSLLGSLFTDRPAAEGGREPEQVMREIDGLRVFATPQKEGSTFRIAGRIEKETDGKVLVRNFVRADVVSDQDEALEFTFRKAQQIIEQNGRTLFSDGAQERNV